MLMCTSTTGDDDELRSLMCCFDSNHASISNDIMLLENQLPWLVLQTLRRFRTVPVEEFIAKMGRTLQIRGNKNRKPFVLDGSYCEHMVDKYLCDLVL